MKRKIKINPIAIKDIKEAKEYMREENISAVNRFINPVDINYDSMLLIDLQRKLLIR